MISVQNRLPEPGKENRVSITPDSGDPVEGVLAYADNASQQGTFWNRSTAQLLQGDIRTYPVREGQSISAGDVVNVGREILSGSEQTYGDLTVGSTVQINENGNPVNYLVVHQGNPDPALYDTSCDGTWLLRSTKFGISTWGPSSNRFPNTTIFNKLQTDFLSVFSEDTLSKIKTVKIPYGNNDYNTSVSIGADGAECKAFLLCPYELGFVGSFVKDGVKLDYFIADNASSEACDLRKGIGATRTENSGWTYVNPSGQYDDVASLSSINFTPCIIFDSSIYTDGAPVYGPETVYKDVIAGSFIDNSQDAIALADGTGGQSIPVGFGGYCECPGVTEGQEINSGGVRAFSPLDGWLKIYEDFSNVFVGSYLGNGADTREINIGFRPKFILVFSVASSTDYVVMCGCVDVSFDNTGFSSFVFRYGGYYAGNTTIISLNDNGFVLGGIGTQITSTANLSGKDYKYVAWR